LTVDPEPIFIRDGELSISAGVTSGIDLALATIKEDLGRTALNLSESAEQSSFRRRPESSTSGQQQSFNSTGSRLLPG